MILFCDTLFARKKSDEEETTVTTRSIAWIGNPEGEEETSLLLRQIERIDYRLESTLGAQWVYRGIGVLVMTPPFESLSVIERFEPEHGFERVT